MQVNYTCVILCTVSQPTEGNADEGHTQDESQSVSGFMCDFEMVPLSPHVPLIIPVYANSDLSGYGC